VDRVQGLDVDYCFYVIPKSSSFSYNLNRFNVATSRAKKCTFILAEVNYEHEVNLQNDVADYLSKLKKEFSFYVHPATKVIEKGISDIIANLQSDNTSPVSASETGVNHNDNEIGIGKTESNPIGLKVVGKIDISKFEKPKRELVQGKENIYIIDTNVFVDYPDIILKIEKHWIIKEN
jgi:hypothetical protein